MLNLFDLWSVLGQNILVGCRRTQSTSNLPLFKPDAEWFQELGSRVIVSPLFRYYEQSNASFYLTSFDADPTDTENPDQPKIPKFYSADYRLAAFRSFTYGLGITVKIHRHVRFDVAFKRYTMHRLNVATPVESFPRANVGTVGLRVMF